MVYGGDVRQHNLCVFTCSEGSGQARTGAIVGESWPSCEAVAAEATVDVVESTWAEHKSTISRANSRQFGH